MKRFQNIAQSFVLDPEECSTIQGGKHVCVVMEGNKVVSTGYSNRKRTVFCGMPTQSLHGEMDAINSLMTNSEKSLVKSQCNLKIIFPKTLEKEKIEQYCMPLHKITTDTLNKKKRQKVWKNRTIIIIRVRYEKDAYTMMESRPCLHCASILYTLGVKRVIYSTNEGTLKEIHLGNGEETFTPSSGSFYTLDKK